MNRAHWAVAIICAVFSTLRPGVADEAWQKGLAVQNPDSKIALLSVRTTLGMDYDFARRTQGPTYFNDCVTIVNRSAVDVVHMQFMYAMVNDEGIVKVRPGYVDVRYRAKPGEVRDDRSNCLDHGFANGGGLRLVAWVNEADFSDGTSWHAPSIDQIEPYIRGALPSAG